jgi:hypothetical protein
MAEKRLVPYSDSEEEEDERFPPNFNMDAEKVLANLKISFEFLLKIFHILKKILFLFRA